VQVRKQKALPDLLCITNRELEVARELSLVDDASAGFRSSIDLEAVDDGQADAVALWFELDLIPSAGLAEEER